MIKRYKQNEIDDLAEILKNDGVISVPTDTVYGLCARMNSKKARENLIATKNRPHTKSIPIMCADIEQIKSIAVVNEREEKIISAFMPGPVTLILLKGPNLPTYVNEDSPEIGIRMATSKALEELIRKVGSPICMTSANQSGEPICTTLDEIEKACPNLDGIMEGDVSFGKASTIIDCTSKVVRILRPGPISMEQINEVLKK